MATAAYAGDFHGLVFIHHGRQRAPHRRLIFSASGIGMQKADGDVIVK